MSAIALIGNLSVDRVEGGPPRAGGGVYHGARAAVQVGADVVVVTRCHPVDRDVALAPLEALGVPVVCADAGETTAFSFHYEGDHRAMRVDAVGEEWTRGDLEGWAAAALQDVGWVHVAGLLRSHFPVEVVEMLATGRRVLCDAQGLLRRATTGPLERDDHVEGGVLAPLTMLKLNEDEGRILAGGLEPERLRALGVPEVLLTLGSRGARVVTADEVVDLPAPPVPGAVDPTGAGDAFSLVYLDGRARGLDPGASAARAIAGVAELLGAA